MVRKRSGKFYFKNEKELMESFGLKPTKGSGSGWLEKEDGQNDYVIAQLKSTDKNSATIKLNDLEKLEYNATVVKKIPIYFLQFLSINKTYALINPLDMPELAKYIECGRCSIKEIPVEIEDNAPEESKKIIKSGNRKNFWRQKQKEWEENGEKSKNKSSR